MILAATGLAVMLFLTVHMFTGRLGFLDVIPRSRWLSMSGGAAVAYVFLHVLPELGGHQAAADRRDVTGLVRSEMYLTAMLGLAVFYGLESYLRSEQAERGGHVHAGHGSFWIHLAAFSFYNLLIGYLLLHRGEEGLWPLAVFSLAMALHFVTLDYGLREDYRAAYEGVARWVLSGAVLGGWLVGLAVTLPQSVIGFIFAFISGAVILNVLKEELPEERQSRFLPFLGGLFGYGALLMATGAWAPR